MLMVSTRTAITVLLLSFAATGCCIYEKYGHGKVAPSRLESASVTAVELPANAPSISQRYRPLFASSESEHKGFDILVPKRTPILAAADGEVERVSLSLFYGNQLILNHGRAAAGYRIQTRYFHLDELLVSMNEKVRRGQLVGYSGLTGLAAGFPHLHFEVHQLDESDAVVAIRDIDPQAYWVDGVGKITCYDSARNFKPTPASLTYPVPCRGTDWQ